MIIVNCKDVLPIQHELLVHVADHLEAIPAIKKNEFVLSPIDSDDNIDQVQVTKIIQEYLESIGEKGEFSVVAVSNKISINSINGKKIDKITPPVRTMRTCCGL
jgi:hypothetical protein